MQIRKRCVAFGRTPPFHGNYGPVLRPAVPFKMSRRAWKRFLHTSTGEKSKMRHMDPSGISDTHFTTTGGPTLQPAGQTARAFRSAACFLQREPSEEVGRGKPFTVQQLKEAVPRATQMVIIGCTVSVHSFFVRFLCTTFVHSFCAWFLCMASVHGFCARFLCMVPRMLSLHTSFFRTLSLHTSRIPAHLLLPHTYFLCRLSLHAFIGRFPCTPSLHSFLHIFFFRTLRCTLSLYAFPTSFSSNLVHFHYDDAL